MRKLVTCLLIIMFGVFHAQAQDKTVTGTVFDEGGSPLPNATVAIKGTSKGVSTNFNGQYKIVVSQNGILVVSFVGYNTKEVAVAGKSSINITLLPDANILDEVVVVAYGVQKKEAITSSVAVIKAEKLADITVSNVSSMLQGKVAGVQVSSAGGSPGSTPSVLIRGMASLSGNVLPLWVVDGVIQHGVPIVNPNDVASMSILKDASATSLYGSRGANGVVIITTKRAKIGVSKLTFSTKVGVNEFNSGNFEVMNSQQLYDYHAQMNNVQDWYVPNLLNRDYDWMGGATQAAAVREYTISYTAATNKMNTYISGGYFSEEGTIKGSDFERYTFRMNVDYKVNDRLTLKPKVSFSFDDRFNAAHGRYGIYTNLPWDAPTDADGNVIRAQESDDWIGRDQSNYFYDLQWNYGTSKTFNMSFNGDFDFKITDDFTFASTNNFTLYNSNGFSYTDPLSIGGEATNGSIHNSSARRFTRLTTQMLRFAKDIDEHSISAVAGYEYNDYEYESLGATGNGFISGGVILDVTAEPASVAGFKNEYALESYFLSTDYSYNNKYFGKASIRRDGASNFGVNNKFATFFSFGAGWNIHKEDFFESDVVNTLKLRASYGSVGNRPGSLYPYQDTYKVTDIHYDGVPGARLSQFGNPDLTWEKSFETNIAIDARFFERFTATLEYYTKNTSDLLYFVNLPDITAYNGYWENVGGLKNTGFEFVLSADVFRSADFKWNLDFNIGVNKNEITELFDDRTEIPRGSKIFKVGEDMNSWYMRKWAGVNSEDGTPQWEKVDTTTGETTLTGNYNEATLQLVGNGTPDFIGGFSSNMNYKGFFLNTNFSFVSGGEIYNSSRSLYDSDGLYPTFNQQVLSNGWSRWENAGDIATHPQAIYGGNNNSNKTSSRYLEDRSYLRLKNITFGYDLSKNLLNRLGISEAKLYVSGDNLFTITDYSGMDPEVGGLGGSTSTSYPTPKRFVVGINFSF